MATEKLNRCWWQAASSGTGDFVYASTISGYEDPTEAGATDGADFQYIAQNGTPPTEWELGIGAYDVGTTTLARTTIVASSNSGSPVTFSAAPNVRMGVPLAADFGVTPVSVTQVGGAPVVFAVSQGSVQVGPTVIYNGPAVSALQLTLGTEQFSSDVKASLGQVEGAIAGTALTSLDLSALTAVGGYFYAGGCTALTSLDLSALTAVGSYFGADGCTALTSLDLSALTAVGDDFGAEGCTALTSLDLSALTAVGGDFYADGCALDQAAVDGILTKLASLDGTGGTTTYDGHTVDLSGGTNASPGVTGLAAKLVLEGRGNTVNVN